MNITPCPQKEQQPVLAIMRKTRKKPSTRKHMPDGVEVIVRVGEVIPGIATDTGIRFWKWEQVRHHGEFKGATAYAAAKHVSQLIRKGVTLTEAEIPADGLWKRVEEVEVLD